MGLSKMAGQLFALGLAAATPTYEAQAGEREGFSVSLPKPANDLERRVGVPVDSANVLKLKLLATGVDTTGDKIQMEGAAYLQIEADGKMRFKDAGFEGYAVLTYSHSFIIYDQADKPLVVIANNASATTAEYQKELSETELAAAKKAAGLLCGCK